jgi:opacity protein-like surface antigen
MKKSLFLLMATALIAGTLDANAQLGVKVGYANSASKLKIENFATVSPKSQSGIFVGVNYDIALTNGLSFRPGITYTYVGGKGVYSSLLGAMDEDFDVLPDIKENDHTLTVPLDMKYAFDVNDDLKIYAFAGPRVAVGLASTVKMDADGESMSMNLYTGKEIYKADGETETYKSENGGPYSRFDLQLGLGAGVQYKRFSLELGYDFGLMNRFRKDFYEGSDGMEIPKLTRNCLVVGLGYSF